MVSNSGLRLTQVQLKVLQPERDMLVCLKRCCRTYDTVSYICELSLVFFLPSGPWSSCWVRPMSVSNPMFNWESWEAYGGNHKSQERCCHGRRSSKLMRFWSTCWCWTSSPTLWLLLYGSSVGSSGSVKQKNVDQVLIVDSVGPDVPVLGLVVPQKFNVES